MQSANSGWWMVDGEEGLFLFTFHHPLIGRRFCSHLGNDVVGSPFPGWSASYWPGTAPALGLRAGAVPEGGSCRPKHPQGRRGLAWR